MAARAAGSAAFGRPERPRGAPGERFAQGRWRRCEARLSGSQPLEPD